MRFLETALPGAFVIEPEPIGDERGAFMRVFCEREFAGRGLESRFVQHSLSQSRHKGTLRGMHFQEDDDAETKLVSCIQGGILDVIVDLRPTSPTYLKWEAFELTPENKRQLYVPKGFGHGFMTLADDTIVHYLISEFHKPTAARGLRYDDPALAIDWPFEPTVVSERDLGWPLLDLASA